MATVFEDTQNQQLLETILETIPRVPYQSVKGKYSKVITWYLKSKLGTIVRIIGAFQCKESLHALHLPISFNLTCVCLKMDSDPQTRAGGAKTKGQVVTLKHLDRSFFSLGVLYCTV